MKTFHEWESELMTKNEGLCLDDRKAVIGLSRLNPLPKNSAANKNLAENPRKAKERAALRVAISTPKPFRLSPQATGIMLRRPV